MSYVAILNDKKFIGIDISQEYCDIANKRIKQAYELKKQIDLRFKYGGNKHNNIN